jgi:hypothetical protein
LHQTETINPQWESQMGDEEEEEAREKEKDRDINMVTIKDTNSIYSMRKTNLWTTILQRLQPTSFKMVKIHGQLPRPTQTTPSSTQRQQQRQLQWLGASLELSKLDSQ